MSLHTKFFVLFFALSRSLMVEVIGLEVKGLVSFLCNLAQVELEKVSRLNQDFLTDLQNVLILISPKPFIFLYIYLVVLSVTEGLLSFKKCSNSFSILFILLRPKLGITASIWVNFGRHIVLITVILPNTVRYLCFQELNSF